MVRSQRSACTKDGFLLNQPERVGGAGGLLTTAATIRFRASMETGGTARAFFFSRTLRPSPFLGSGSFDLTHVRN